MIDYEFGIMSNKWKLSAPDKETAYITMSLYIGKNVLIGVYSPDSECFKSMDVLEKNKDTFDPELVKACLRTVERLV